MSKMPNKIYINKYMLRRGMLYPAQKPADVPEFEYICKDTLLDIIKEQKKIAMGFSYEHLQMIEDKIKEL